MCVRKYFANLLDGVVDRVVDNLILILAGPSQFAAGNFQTALDRLFRFGPAGSQPPLQLFLGTRPEKNRGHPG